MASRPSWTLVIEDRFGTVTDEFVFDAGELVIGRSRQCDIVLPSENVSRRHACVRIEDGHLFVEDVGSSNGVWFDGLRLQGPQELRDGDVVKVGDFQLRVKGSREGQEERVVHARLIGRSPGAMNQSLEVVAATTLVGRGRDCGLVLIDPSVSRVHARIVVRPDGAILVEDVGSANGLFVNDTRVKVWQLSGGERVRFGNVEFVVSLPGIGTTETPVPGLRVRPRRVLPWVGGIAMLAAALVVLIVLVPRLMVPEGNPPPPNPQAPAVQAPAAAAPPLAGEDAVPAPLPAATALEKARGLLAARRLDEAQVAVDAVRKADPANVEAVQLANRLQVEQAAAKGLAEADKALAENRSDDAVRGLLAIPVVSLCDADARARLRGLLPLLARDRDKACAGRGAAAVPCILKKSLLVKVEERLKAGSAAGGAATTPVP